MAGKDALTAFLRALIWLYRHSLSYFLGSRCRFTPTCSAYADEALSRHGPFKGSWLALRRLGRCHPWGGQGYDPVPEAKAGNRGSESR
ncbi:MAG: membrane protein insertion efficiency factor YidD [Alphaproteobacteria bacterium]|nr:membrane protein insertion efficiency factor YidD [Alphaproteobacteria bacterium]